MKHAIELLPLTAMLLTMTTSALCATTDDYDHFTADAYVTRGGAKGAERDLDGAIADYTKAIELEPIHADRPSRLATPYYYRGVAKQNKGDLDGAIADYTKSIELTPGNGNAYVKRAESNRAKGEMAAAMTDYTKAVDLNPKYAWAYHLRGCFRYDTHAFADALTDFRKEVELDSSSDYARLRLWLIRARLGESEAATTELQTYLSGHRAGQPEDWPTKIGHFLTGQLGESDFLAAAKNADAKKEAGQLCLAYFYIGSKHLLAADKGTARNYFEKSVATGQKDSFEYASAVAELKYLSAEK